MAQRPNQSNLHPQMELDLTSTDAHLDAHRKKVRKPIRPLAKDIRLLTSLTRRHESIAQKIAIKHGFSTIMSRLLAVRGFTVGPKLDQYLAPPDLRNLRDIWSIKNIDKVVAQIHASIREGKKIMLYGDYDVDGTTGVAILYRTIKALGGDVYYYSPDRRSEGYGAKRDRIVKLREMGIDHLITIDFGTKNAAELDFARSIGIFRVSVIDHHHIPNGLKPPCEAFINIRQDGCGWNSEDVSASGLSFVTALALKDLTQRHASDGPVEAEISRKASDFKVEKLSQLAFLGIVADVVNLNGAARIICKLGAAALETDPLPGPAALKEKVNVRSDTRAEDVAFGFAPRGNAPGRIFESFGGDVSGAMLAIELYTSDDLLFCRTRAGELEEHNETRKTIQRENDRIIREEIGTLHKRPKSLAIMHRAIDERVCGINASAISNEYYVPTIILRDMENGVAQGSGRCVVEGVNLATLHEDPRVSKLLLKHGGHAAAIGVSLPIENVERYRHALARVLSESHLNRRPNPVIRADLEVTLADLKQEGPSLYKEIKRLQPCGMGNLAPLFILRRLHVLDVEVLRGAHLKLQLLQRVRVGTRFEDSYVTAFMWSRGSSVSIQSGMVLDAVASPTIDRKKRFDYSPNDVELEIVEAKRVPKKAPQRVGNPSQPRPL